MTATQAIVTVESCTHCARVRAPNTEACRCGARTFAATEAVRRVQSGAYNFVPGTHCAVAVCNDPSLRLLMVMPPRNKVVSLRTNEGTWRVRLGLPWLAWGISSMVTFEAHNAVLMARHGPSGRPLDYDIEEWGPFRMGNVDGGARICWGDNHLPTRPSGVDASFFNAPFNHDLTDRGNPSWGFQPLRPATPTQSRRNTIDHSSGIPLCTICGTTVERACMCFTTPTGSGSHLDMYMRQLMGAVLSSTPGYSLKTMQGSGERCKIVSHGLVVTSNTDVLELTNAFDATLFPGRGDRVALPGTRLRNRRWLCQLGKRLAIYDPAQDTFTVIGRRRTQRTLNGERAHVPTIERV